MKKFLLFLSLLISCISFSREPEWIPFQWVRSMVGDRYIDKSAIRVPVRIDSLPHQFTMQLDLGTITTTFSGNAIDPYLETYPSLRNKLDTTRKYAAHGKENPLLTGVELRLGSYVFKNVEVGYNKGYGRIIEKDSIHKTNMRIGAIGADLFQDKILIIDFPEERLAIADQLPVRFQNLEFVSLKNEQGRIKLPFRINGTQEFVLFDTGASSFALSTTKERAMILSDYSMVTDSLRVPSWGKYLTLRGMKTNKSVYLGSHKLKEAIVYYDETGLYDSFMATQNVWGLTGNTYFLESTIVIDYRNNLFGVKWD